MANILVVEDDVDVAEVLAALLAEAGHDVRQAQNGQAGIAQLLERTPDLIICDVEMPLLSGPDMALRVFLSDAGRELIPILLISGTRDLARVAEGVGTPYFLSKPFTVEQVMGKLEQALHERQPPHPTRAAPPSAAE